MAWRLSIGNARLIKTYETNNEAEILTNYRIKFKLKLCMPTLWNTIVQKRGEKVTR